ncbi:hypothetical protein [Clostridium baratii]|uniref:hypothetical protein n=1 Tax=Clostridium baratii TaxID=1561 RepID=UPI0030CDF2DC
MKTVRELYDEYIEELNMNNEVGLDYEDYLYMYSLYLRRSGYYVNSEDEINEALKMQYKLSHLDFYDIRESGIYVSPMRDVPMFNLKEYLRKSDVELERFNVTSIENEREYIETDCGIVEFNINKILEERSNLRVKDGYKIVFYKIQNGFEDKYKVFAFRGYNMTLMPSENTVVDTFFEGVDLEFDDALPFMEGIRGENNPNTYMEALLLFNEIMELQTGEKGDIMLYGENKYMDNSFVPEDPKLYDTSLGKVIEYYGYVEGNGGYSFSRNVVAFNEYSFEPLIWKGPR